MNVHMDDRRTMPKVPGLNAQPLQPSIGAGDWRLSRGQKVVRSQIRKAGIWSGSTDHNLIPDPKGAPESKPLSKSARKRAFAAARKRGMIAY